MVTLIIGLTILTIFTFHFIFDFGQPPGGYKIGTFFVKAEKCSNQSNRRYKGRHLDRNSSISLGVR